jgi:vacuolar-type H+-ATPase subunit E/Vma4
MSPARTVEESLAPLRAELLRRARADAARTTAAADDDAARLLAAARAQAEALLQTARDDGAADVAALLGAERSRVRRRTRSTVLRAQTHVLTELERRTLETAQRLCSAPEYPRWREGLVRAVRSALGPQATVVDHPAGGVVGTADSRRVDLSLPALVGRALAEATTEVQQLWAGPGREDVP